MYMSCVHDMYVCTESVSCLPKNARGATITLTDTLTHSYINNSLLPHTHSCVWLRLRGITTPPKNILPKEEVICLLTAQNFAAVTVSTINS